MKVEASSFLFLPSRSSPLLLLLHLSSKYMKEDTHRRVRDTVRADCRDLSSDERGGREENEKSEGGSGKHRGRWYLAKLRWEVGKEREGRTF